MPDHLAFDRGATLGLGLGSGLGSGYRARMPTGKHNVKHRRDHGARRGRGRGAAHLRTEVEQGAVVVHGHAAYGRALEHEAAWLEG